MSSVTVFFLLMQCVSAHVRYNKLRADDLLFDHFWLHAWLGARHMAGTCVEVYRLSSEVVVICSYVGYLQISGYVGKAVLCTRIMCLIPTK
jgi:hypothetical protein